MFRKSKLNSGTHYIMVEICTIHTSMVEQGPVPHVSKYFCSNFYLFSASSMEYISENVDKIYQSVLVLWLFQHLQNLACLMYKNLDKTKTENRVSGNKFVEIFNFYDLIRQTQSICRIIQR